MIDRDLVNYLNGFVTPERRDKMERVLAERTRYISVLVEDIYQPHNASAVLRTCDCFGVQDVHIVENRNQYRLNPGVELGTAQWLTLTKYSGKENNTPEAIARLQEAGYRVVATTPHTNQCSLGNFGLDAGPVALMFGNEPDGLSDSALELADEHLVIPMYGFVESFNISVSAAIILSALTTSLRAGQIGYHLSPEEEDQIRLQWLRNSIGRVDALEREYYLRRDDGEAAANGRTTANGEAAANGESAANPS